MSATPGPWNVVTGAAGVVHIVDAHGDLIATCHDDNVDRIANATLIAMAPRMAAILRSIDGVRDILDTIEGD